MINWVEVKTKYADGSVSNDTHYLFVERNYKNPAYGEWIYRNVHGGFCTKDCIEVVNSGIFTGTKEDFIALHRKEFYLYLIKKNSPYGWLSPFCEWIPCSYLHHQDVAEDYLGYDERELEKRGWIKVFKEYDSDKAVYAQINANERQLEWLGNHQVHYSKYACMQ